MNDIIYALPEHLPPLNDGCAHCETCLLCELPICDEKPRSPAARAEATRKYIRVLRQYYGMSVAAIAQRMHKPHSEVQEALDGMTGIGSVAARKQRKKANSRT